LGWEQALMRRAQRKIEIADVRRFVRVETRHLSWLFVVVAVAAVACTDSEEPRSGVAVTSTSTTSFPPQTSDSSLGLVVPEGFRPGVLAASGPGRLEYIAIDISTGESVQFTAQNVGVLGSPVAGTLLPDGVVVISDLISEEGNGSQANVFDNGLTQEPTTLRTGFSTSPSWLVPTPDPRLVWFAEAQPPWRIELHSVVDQSVVMETSIDLGENLEMHPVGATTDGLVFKTLVYEDLGQEGRTPILESESLFLVEPSGDKQHLGDGSALTVGPNALYLYECDESGCTLIEVRTDTGARREISNRQWNTPTFSADTGEASDQWSSVNPSETKMLLRDDSGVVVLDLQTKEPEPVPSTRFTLAAWTEDDEIVLISERSVQTVNADGSVRDVATIPAGFYVLDAGSNDDPLMHP
jgi:hypothetical protein